MDLKKSFARHYYARTLMTLRMMSRVHVNERLTFNSVLYMDLIAFTENCTVSKLADMLHISKSSVTIKVNELVEQGYVTKTRSEADGRIYYLSIAPEENEAYDEDERQVGKMINRLKEKYSKEELEKFGEMLDETARFWAEQSV
ncbi:MarR family transcriptional regulator [Methanomassiliicoccus luminyensis]|jgi:DNA-binding MarR family transcriptional regulator|uniref:MarR family transcriptional regulator n=1 Tax=Methanomassiliicoccus luminyensis TaxID=1080712 RepID=UPI00036B2015|nr:MarR family transcriptional regulator [Methanomassiliicoccus luminyensis]